MKAVPTIIESQTVAQPSSPPIPKRLYVVQQAELSASPGIIDPENVADLVERSPAAGEIFKFTTRVYEASVDLVDLVPTNKSAFGDFIDCIYLVFYEGAGKDKLRYLSSNGGSLSDNDCGIVWAIKILRNKWYRHDPDHGDTTSVNRSYRSLKETLQRFGFPNLPCNAGDYRRLHSLLTDELVRLLEKLRESLV